MASNVVDPRELSIEEGTYLVRLARKTISTYLTIGRVLETPRDVSDKLLKYGMCFVTLLKYPSSDLRGCIGYTQPIEPLVKNVISAAIAAATQDPRFPPLTTSELDSIIIEVSVLSIPTELGIKPEDRLRSIVIGRDGLIIDFGPFKGLLLPEVPVEYCWDVETFLSETCIKAGLKPDCWLSNKVKVFKYYARTFRELRPGGDVIERNLSKEYEEKCSYIK